MKHLGTRSRLEVVRFLTTDFTDVYDFILPKEGKERCVDANAQ